jgi:uncharacterized lipoprotein YajG
MLESHVKILHKSILLIVLALIAFTACASEPEVLEIVESIAEEPPMVEPTSTVEPTEVEAGPTPTIQLTPEPEIDEACVDCHADQSLLQALATEAEPEESLSSGEG